MVESESRRYIISFGEEFLRKKILKIADIFLDLLLILQEKDIITRFEHGKLVEQIHELSEKIA